MLSGFSYSLLQPERAGRHLGSADDPGARYVVLTRRMEAVGPNLGEPHTKSIDHGLFELRLKGAEGIARVFFCVQIGKHIVMLHSFVKKTDRIPLRELDVARNRLKEIKNERS